MKKLKNFIITLFLVIILSISTTCFADTNETQEDVTATPYAIDSSENTTTVVDDDLYLYGDDINMNQIVDGNVYIFGKNVTINGEVDGDLFVCASNVSFGEHSYINSNAYIVADKIDFNTSATSLYAACNELNIPEGYGPFRDLYVMSSKLSLQGAVGRNAYVYAPEFIISTDSVQGSITGKLTYVSENEVEFPSGAVGGEITHLTTSTSSNARTTIWSIVINIVNSIFAASLVYLLYRFFLESSLEKASSCLSHKFGKVFLAGLIALIAIPILSIILIAAQIGFSAGLLLLMLYVFMIGISPYIFASILARRIYNNKKFSKMPLEYLLAILIAVVIGALKMIPFVGIVVTIFISILGFGIIIYNLFFNGHKHKEVKSEENVAN